MHLIFCAYSYHFRCFNLYYFFEDLHFLWVIYLYSQSASFNISYGAGLLEMETLATVCLKMSYFTFILSDFFSGYNILGWLFFFFWFIEFSSYWWLYFILLYLSGHFCLVVRHCEVVGNWIFLSSCQYFWVFLGGS